MNVLVTGGAGYIGSHTCQSLIEFGNKVVVVDNLSNSSLRSIQRVEEITRAKIAFYQIDVRDKPSLIKVFEQNDIDAVIHFAGLKSVSDSVIEPISYYQNNVIGTIILCEVMQYFGCKTFVFSSSATVYGDSKVVPIKENSPLSATNPYGQSKITVELFLRDLFESDNSWCIALLRYFNPVGAHKSGLIGEDPQGTPSNLMPYISQVAIGKIEKLSIFGNDYKTHDGTGVRDYIHVLDLAEGHLNVLEFLKRNPQVLTLNLGTGVGYSVLDIVKVFEKISGKKVPYEFVARRSGDISKCFADVTLAEKIISWRAIYGLEEMCLDTWRWQSMNPSGYAN